MTTTARARFDLECDLRQALVRNELRVFYQPEVDLVSGAIVGMEALVRWQHPTRGLVAPAQFIPLAEETGLIVPIGRWVLAEACRQASRWRAQRPGAPALTMSVNLSVRQLEQPGVVAMVAATLAQRGLPPAALRLELTESLLVADNAANEGTLLALKSLGVGLAIDDFGSGYSSLSYLSRLPVDTLKIDRSFVAELGQDERMTAIVVAVTTLAHALGLTVIAEGAETAEQLARLQELHCDRGQGYYFARPLPAAAMTALLRDGLSVSIQRPAAARLRVVS